MMADLVWVRVLRSGRVQYRKFANCFRAEFVKSLARSCREAVECPINQNAIVNTTDIIGEEKVEKNSAAAIMRSSSR